MELLETFRLRSDHPYTHLQDNSDGGWRNRLILGGTRVKRDNPIIQAVLVGMGCREMSRLVYKINYVLIVKWNKEGAQGVEADAKFFVGTVPLKETQSKGERLCGAQIW